MHQMRSEPSISAPITAEPRREPLAPRREQPQLASREIFLSWRRPWRWLRAETALHLRAAPRRFRIVESLQPQTGPIRGFSLHQASVAPRAENQGRLRTVGTKLCYIQRLRSRRIRVVTKFSFDPPSASPSCAAGRASPRAAARVTASRCLPRRCRRHIRRRRTTDSAETSAAKPSPPNAAFVSYFEVRRSRLKMMVRYAQVKPLLNCETATSVTTDIFSLALGQLC